MIIKIKIHVINEVTFIRCTVRGEYRVKKTNSSFLQSLSMIIRRLDHKASLCWFTEAVHLSDNFSFIEI